MKGKVEVKKLTFRGAEQYHENKHTKLTGIFFQGAVQFICASLKCSLFLAPRPGLAENGL